MEIVSIEMGVGMARTNDGFVNALSFTELVVTEVPYLLVAINFGFVLEFEKHEWDELWHFKTKISTPIKEMGVEKFALSPNRMGKFPRIYLLEQHQLFRVKELGIYEIEISGWRAKGGSRQSLTKKFPVFLSSHRPTQG